MSCSRVLPRSPLMPESCANFTLLIFYLNKHTASSFTFTMLTGSVVERPFDREVAGSIPGRVIPKTLKWY